ncbi:MULTISPECIES: hypothetical protein [Streptomyces]|uniref:Secreted protein n=1 Tax=Streptomyces pini TaxID=1520580 RepID=A0A1I4B2H5_9ACTN|nr:hypothetical protein [Streptomyces pini]SFK62753.1 hypothetical protein SAMN05192584_107219 [Streptomyces pini]
MKRSRIRTAITAMVGSAALALGGLAATPAGAATSAAPPAQKSLTAASGFWACTVPAGKTYTDTDRRYRGNCNPSGWGTSYYVVDPADGVWACTVPSGYTYTDTDRTYRGNCNAQDWGTAYLLAVPRTGIWACTIPPGFSYTDTDRRYRGNCNPQDWGTAYLLVG